MEEGPQTETITYTFWPVLAVIFFVAFTEFTSVLFYQGQRRFSLAVNSGKAQVPVRGERSLIERQSDASGMLFELATTRVV